MTYFRREAEYQHEVELALAHGHKPPERSERNSVIEAYLAGRDGGRKCWGRCLDTGSLPTSLIRASTIISPTGFALAFRDTRHQVTEISGRPMKRNGEALSTVDLSEVRKAYRCMEIVLSKL